MISETLRSAGSIDEAGLYRLSWARGQAMLDAGRRSAGAMVAAQADRERVRQALQGCDEVWIANHNGPQQTAVSGTMAGIGTPNRA